MSRKLKGKLDEGAIKQALGVLATILLPPPAYTADPGASATAWSQALADLPGDEVLIAFYNWGQGQTAWPTPKGIRGVVEGAREAAKLQEQREQHLLTYRDGPENFAVRAQRLGFTADRLSALGVGCFSGVLDEHMGGRIDDVAVTQALSWCEAHPGATWQAPKSPRHRSAELF